jgi:catechol 2,3-dioxygenase-like lactoylglutathione lyase family enzyme
MPNDPMEPIAAGERALTGPLSGALLVTRDLAMLRRAYVDGVGLALAGPLPMSAAQTAAQRKLWQMPADLHWQIYTLTRPSLPTTIRVLVIVPDRDTPVIRSSYDRQQTGPYALGFATRDVRAVDARVIALGLKRTLPAVNEYNLQLRDGTPYPVTEASYEIGDFNRLVLMGRGGGLNQIGAVEDVSGLGGPSYSSLIVENAAAMEAFFTTVLDFERRSSREWTQFQPRFRYVTLHARGARTGNLGLVEYQATDRMPGTGVAPRPPNRGLAGWSFAVKDLDQVLRRANARGIKPLTRPLQIVDPRFGAARMTTLLAPNGLLIELYQL